jgi:hypothetical protein
MQGRRGPSLTRIPKLESSVILSPGLSGRRISAVVYCTQHPQTNCRDASPAERDQHDSTHAQRLDCSLLSERGDGALTLKSELLLKWSRPLGLREDS